MTSHRLLVRRGTACLIITSGLTLGACSAENPDADGGSGGKAGSGGGNASGSSGTTSTAGVGGIGGKTTTGGAAGSTGQAGSGGADSGGQGGTSTGTAGKGGSAGAGGGGGLPLKNPPVPSEGCGKPPMLTTGSKMIESSGDSRHYNVDIPTGYDMTKAYRVIYEAHGLGGSGDSTKNGNYYGLKPVAEGAGDPAIFIAPSGLDGSWGEKDHPLFDDLLALVKKSLCVDTSRVFVLGFSFGGMYTYSLSLNHQQDIRAGLGLGPANYNIWLPPNTHAPIAWMQTTGMSDPTTPWVRGDSTTEGSKYIAIQRATDNGCKVPTDIPTWKSGGPFCYDFEGCKPGYPVKVCTFDGKHSRMPGDPQVMWEFITQF